MPSWITHGSPLPSEQVYLKVNLSENTVRARINAAGKHIWIEMRDNDQMNGERGKSPPDLF